MRSNGLATATHMGRWRVSAASALLAAALTGCSGGGSDDEADKALQMSVTSVPTLDADVYAGYGAFPDIEVRFDFSGDLGRMVGRTFYARFEDPGGLFVGPAELTINYPTGKDHRIVVRQNGPVNVGRVPGLLQAAVKLQVCYDPFCAEPVAGNSSITIPYSMRIRQGATLDFTASPVRVPFGEVPPEVFVPLRIPDGVTVEGIEPPVPTRCVIQCSRFANLWRQSDLVLSGPAAGVKVAIWRPLPIGQYQRRMTVNATGVTSRGSQPAGFVGDLTFEVVPNPALSVLVQPSWVERVLEDSVLSKRASMLVLEARGQPVRSFRVEYLPAGPEGNQDAGGIGWITWEISGQEDFFDISIQRCTYDFLPTGLVRRCLPAGRYDAVVHFALDAQTVSVPITVRIEGAPPPL